MSKVLVAVALAALFLRWLAAAQVMLPVDGVPVGVPVLVIAVLVAVVAMAGLAALVVWRTRAEQAMVAAWQPRTATVRVIRGAR